MRGSGVWVVEEVRSWWGRGSHWVCLVWSRTRSPPGVRDVCVSGGTGMEHLLLLKPWVYLRVRAVSGLSSQVRTPPVPFGQSGCDSSFRDLWEG